MIKVTICIENVRVPAKKITRNNILRFRFCSLENVIPLYKIENIPALPLYKHKPAKDGSPNHAFGLSIPRKKRCKKI